jgi:hypothetical protein
MKGQFHHVIFLFLFHSVFTFPLLGQDRNALTHDLEKMIEDRDIDIAVATSLLKRGQTLTVFLQGTPVII